MDTFIFRSERPTDFIHILEGMGMNHGALQRNYVMKHIQAISLSCFNSWESKSILSAVSVIVYLVNLSFKGSILVYTGLRTSAEQMD